MTIGYHLGENGRDGQCGEIPEIFLNYQENLLPVNKTKEIKPDILFDNLERSRLDFLWLIGDKQIRVIANCELQDQRLKKQLKENVEFAERLIKWAVKCKSSLIQKDTFKVNELLAETEIPDALRPFVEQVKKWKEFIGVLKDKNELSTRYGSRLHEGYYQAVVYYSAFRIPALEKKLTDLSPSDELAEPEVLAYSPLFDFDREKHPPKIDDNCIWWELPKKKVRIILPHDNATKEIIEYYGYQEVYQQFLLAREANREAEHQRYIAYSKEVAEERKSAEEKLLKTLLS